MLLSIEGEEATTKTTTALTSPKPLVMFAFDVGEERAINGTKFDEFFADKKIDIIRYDAKVDPDTLNKSWKKGDGFDITVFELPRPIQLDDALFHGITEQWNYFISLFGYITRDDYVKSIIVDTMTKARKIKADSHLQVLQEKTKGSDNPRMRLLEIEYAAPNGAIESLYSIVKGMGDQNLIATHHLRDQYKDTLYKGEIKQMRTGKLELEGWNKTHTAVDVAIRMSKSNSNGEGLKIGCEILKCGYNLSLEGLKLSDPTWDKLTGQIMDSLGGRIEL
jgi:hypothetical protein